MSWDGTGVMPLSEFSPEKRAEIEWLAAQREAPPKWLYFGENKIAGVVSRAWREWHKRTHRELAKKRYIGKRQRIIDRDGMVCGICKDAITSMSDLHIDHIIPLARGGSSDPANLQPAHALCNMIKGAS